MSVTVVIPTYNHRKFLNQAICSCIAQTKGPEGLIVVDDCSDDGTGYIVSGWEKRGVRAVTTHENSGMVYTINLGASLVDTEFLVLLSGDDILHPMFIELTLSAIGDADFAYVDAQFFGDRGDVWKAPDQFPPRNLRKGNAMPYASLLRASAWEAVGGYNPKDEVWADYGLWLEFAKRGFKGIHVPETLFFYRSHPDQMSRTMPPEEAERLHALVLENHP